jgi:hypothetical protein
MLVAGEGGKEGGREGGKEGGVDSYTVLLMLSIYGKVNVGGEEGREGGRVQSTDSLSMPD